MLQQKATPPSHVHAGTASKLRVGTYNVFNGMHDPKGTVKAIRQMNADVIAMQEIAPPAATMLDRALKRNFPYRYFSNGLGIVSRFPLQHPRFQRSKRGINGFLCAEIDHPRGRMQMANVHLDPLRIWTIKEKLALPIQLLWRQGSIHRSELRQVQQLLRSDLPTVVLGDFNSASHAATDRLRAIGFTDSFASVTRKPDHHPTLHFSFLGTPAGRRIDFIFHDRAFETIESRIAPGRPSDHDPVISVLRY